MTDKTGADVSNREQHVLNGEQPAYPCLDSMIQWPNSGMSKREDFAKAIMAAMAGDPSREASWKVLAKEAVEAADTLLEQLAATKETK